MTPQHMEDREHPTLGLTPALHRAGLCYLSLLCFLYPGITTGPQKTIKKIKHVINAKCLEELVVTVQ